MSHAADLHRLPERARSDELAITDDEIIGAIEASLAAQGRGETVIEPRMHLCRTPTCTATSTCCAARSARRSNLAGVKVIGDYVDNYKHGLPSEVASCAVRPANGVPRADHRRRRHHRHAHRRGDRDRRQVPRAAKARACSAISARAAPPTGTCACSTTCSTSTKSASIRAGRRAATPSRRGSRGPRQAGDRAPTTGTIPRCGRRHRGRSLAPARAARRC